MNERIGAQYLQQGEVPESKTWKTGGVWEVKRFLAVFMVMALAIAIFGGSAVAMEKRGNTIVLKAADDHTKGYPTVDGLDEMARYVKEATDGRIIIEVYPGAVLGSEKESIEQTQMGVIDLNRVSIAPVTSVYPKMSVFSLPYIFRSREHMFQVLDGELGQQMLTELEKVGFVGMCYMDSGARSFYTVGRQVKSPAEVKGMKIRVQKSPVMIEMVQALGGKPVPMAFEEVYTALQTGVIDGAENNPPSYHETSHYEVAKYYSLDGHAMVPEIVLMSKRTWDQLSDADREILMEAAKSGEKVQKAAWLKREVEAMEVVKASGCTIVEPDKQPFIEAMKPVYDKYAADYADLIAKVQAVGK